VCNLLAFSGRIGSGKDLSTKIIQALTNRPTAFDKFNVVTEELVEERIWDIPLFENKKFADSLKDMMCIMLGCTRAKLEDRDYKNTELGEEWWYYKGRHGSLISYTEDSLRSSEDLIKLTPRLLLQLLGTECGRQILHPNIWVNALFSKYVDCKPKKGPTDFSIQNYSHAECVDCKKRFSGYKRQFICNDCYDTHEWKPNWIISDMRFPNEMEAVKSRGGVTVRIVKATPTLGGHIKIGDNHIHASAQGIREFDKAIRAELGIVEHESENALDNAKFDYTIINDGTIKELVEKIKILLKQLKLI
jgi:hypothetical protein